MTARKSDKANTEMRYFTAFITTGLVLAGTWPSALLAKELPTPEQPSICWLKTGVEQVEAGVEVRTPSGFWIFLAPIDSQWHQAGTATKPGPSASWYPIKPEGWGIARRQSSSRPFVDVRSGRLRFRQAVEQAGENHGKFDLDLRDIILEDGYILSGLTLRSLSCSYPVPPAPGVR
jgi:hypothetical protein